MAKEHSAWPFWTALSLHGAIVLGTVAATSRTESPTRLRDVSQMSVSLLSPAPVSREARPKAAVAPRSIARTTASRLPLPTPVLADAPMQTASLPPVTAAPAVPSPALRAAGAAPAGRAAVLSEPAREAAPVTPARFDAAYLNNPAPNYPLISRRLGEEGRVLLRVWVGADGAAAEVAVRTSSGSSRLDEAAMSAVRQWRFVPARRGDEPVAGWVVVPINFHFSG